VAIDAAPLEEISSLIGDLRSGIAGLSAGLAHEGAHDPLAEAMHARDVLLPAMAAVRTAADTLEGTVADDLWPLPTYQEMLYIL
jgi:glutamine synthetase